MSLETVSTEVTTPVAETAAPADDNLSLSSFEAKYSGDAAATTVAEPEAAPVAPVAPAKRSRRQNAGAADVPRIHELTRRLREAEAERDALKGRSAPPAAPAAQPPAAVTPPTAAPARPAAVAAPSDPEPTYEQDPTTGKAYEDLNKWMRDYGLWAGREALRARDTETANQTKAQQQAAEVTRLETQWKSGVTAAKTKYPDFEAVAFAPTRIPQGSLVDAWVREHKVGTDLLYHLQKNPTELDAMLALPLFDQVEALTLLTQRLSGSRTGAVTTGAAPTPVAQPVSRPPTPVRTGPIAPANEPPDPEKASLRAHEGFYGGSRRRG